MSHYLLWQLPVWEAISRLSQLICCHTQHYHLWTDIMKCTLKHTLVQLIIHLTMLWVKFPFLIHYLLAICFITISNFSNLLQSCLRIFTHVVHQHYIIYHSPCQKSFHPQIVPTLRIFTHAVHQHYIIYQHHYLFNLYNFKNKYY